MIDKISYKDIPSKPGCYIYKDSKGSIIYIGKAKDLKKRVKSYFSRDLDIKTDQLVKNLDSVDFIVTDNEVEALILENTLIKKHKPKYNIDLKDSKRYAYVQITGEKFPRLLTARSRGNKGTFFGPFVSGSERQQVIRLLTRTFKIRTCKRLPKKACLRYHINLCSAPCIGNISEEEYDEKVALAASVLKGDTSNMIRDTKLKMQKVSKEMRYEKAMEYREMIRALEHLEEKQNMERMKRFDEDIINYLIKEGTVYLILFNVYKGTLVNKQEFSFAYSEDFLEEFIVQYYSENSIPKELIIAKDPGEGVTKYLSKKKGSRVLVTVPKRGSKVSLLKLVKKNIELSFFAGMDRMKDLKEKIRLNETPHIIECFDISHLSGTSTVGSMVQFREGKPDKSNYRRFRIRTVEGIDDFAAITEVVERRYSRVLKENKEMPNLIIIDGGKGQLKAALDVLKKIGVRLPIISIAKREEEIFTPGMRAPIRLDKKEKALQFIQEIRDEAHRFAIMYNRLLRKKEIK